MTKGSNVINANISLSIQKLDLIVGLTMPISLRLPC